LAISAWVEPSAHLTKTGRSSGDSCAAISSIALRRSIAASIVSPLLAASCSSARSVGLAESFPPVISLRVRSMAMSLAILRQRAFHAPTVAGRGRVSQERTSTLAVPSSSSCRGQRFSSSAARIAASTRLSCGCESGSSSSWSGIEGAACSTARYRAIAKRRAPNGAFSVRHRGDGIRG